MSDSLSESTIDPVAKASAVKNLSQRKVVRFAGVGAVSTLVDIAVFNLLLIGDFSAYVAAGVGFFAGFTNGYFMNSRYVFKTWSRGKYIRYLTVSFVGFLLTELIIDLAHYRGGLSENVAKLGAVAVVFIWNYLMSKYWAFR